MRSDRRCTYRIVSGDKQTVKVAPPTSKPGPISLAKKAKSEPKPEKLSALSAAKVLATTGEPMTTKGMLQPMTEQGLWTSTDGKTASATLYAAILRGVATKGAKAQFRKTAPSHFTFNTASTQH